MDVVGTHAVAAATSAKRPSVNINARTSGRSAEAECVCERSDSSHDGYGATAVCAELDTASAAAERPGLAAAATTSPKVSVAMKKYPLVAK